jgi:hypothetical protein
MPRWHLALSTALVLLFATLCVTSGLQKSATWDEYRIGIGARRDVPGGLFHPPLSSVLHSLPFLWLEIPESVWQEPSGPLRGQKIVSLREDDLMLDAARIAGLPVAIAGLCLGLFWSRKLYGGTGAAIAGGLLSFDPNVIAHARLITPDTTLAVTTLLALFALARVGERAITARRFALGVAFALMLLSKFTALLLIPILLLVHLGACLRFDGASAAAVLRRCGLDATLALGIAGGIVWGVYGFSLGSVPFGPETSITLPAPEYAAGAVYQWYQSQQPHQFFLLGDRSADGWWYFYAVVIAAKVPLGTLALLGLAAFGGRRLGIAPRRDELYLVAPALILLVYLSFFNTIHNGFRYLLPVWLPLLVFVGRLGPVLLGNGLRRAAVAVPLLAAIVAGASAWPDYLAFSNTLFGGSRHAYQVFSDSNLDWGQDLEALRAWMDDAGVDRVQLAYFGSADPAHWGIDYVSLPSPTSALPPRGLPEGAPLPRWVALSAYQYQGVGFGDANPYARFHALVPNARAGASILLFDLDDPRPR